MVTKSANQKGLLRQSFFASLFRKTEKAGLTEKVRFIATSPKAVGQNLSFRRESRRRISFGKSERAFPFAAKAGGEFPSETGKLGFVGRRIPEESSSFSDRMAESFLSPCRSRAKRYFLQGQFTTVT